MNIKIIFLFNFILNFLIKSIPVQNLIVTLNADSLISKRQYELSIIKAIEIYFGINIDFQRKSISIKQNIQRNIQIQNNSPVIFNLINNPKNFISLGTTFQVYRFWSNIEKRFLAIKILREKNSNNKFLHRFIWEVSAFFLIESLRSHYLGYGSENVISLIDVNFFSLQNGNITVYLVYEYEQISLMTVYINMIQNVKLSMKLYATNNNDEIKRKIEARKKKGETVPSEYFNKNGWFYPYFIKILYSMLKAALFLEQIDIIHGDIKPDNITLSCENVDLKLYINIENFLSLCEVSKLRVKLIDFDRYLRNSFSIRAKYLNAPNYRAPETILNFILTNGVDVWAIGVIAFELYSGEIWCSLDIEDKNDSRRFLRCIENRLNINIEDGFGKDKLFNDENIRIFYSHSDGSEMSINVEEYIEFRKNEWAAGIKKIFEHGKLNLENFVNLVNEKKIKNFYGTYIKNKELLYLFSRIFVVDPQKRAKASELLKSRLFNDVK